MLVPQSVFNAIGIEKPLIVMPPNIRFIDLCSILDFIYLGHANVPQNRLDEFLKAGELFQIRGIKEGRYHFLTTTQGRQQFHSNTTQINNLKSIVVTPLNSSGGSSSSSSFDQTISSTQDPSAILRPPSKRIREEDEQDISIQEASEIMKMLLDHPELDDHPIKPEQLKENSVVEVQQMKNQTQNETTTQQSQTGTTCSAQPVNCAKPKFLCRFCGRGLSTKGRVQKHENECNDNPHREIVFCEVCFIELKPSSLNHHMNSKHGIKNNIKTPRHQPASYGPMNISPIDKNTSALLKTTSTSTTTVAITTVPAQQSPDGNNIIEKSPDHSTPLSKDMKVEEKQSNLVIVEKEIVNEEPQINVD